MNPVEAVYDEKGSLAGESYMNSTMMPCLAAYVGHGQYYWSQFATYVNRANDTVRTQVEDVTNMFHSMFRELFVILQIKYR